MRTGIISSKVYYIILSLLIVLYIGLSRYYFTDGKFLIWGAVPIVIFVICKDAFTGAHWFKRNYKSTPNLTEEPAIAEPVPAIKKQGYFQLLHLLVAPIYHPVMEKFIYDMQTVDGTNEANTPLYSLANYADSKNICFIMGLDIKADTADLEWRITSALKQNFDKFIILPNKNKWPSNMSISSHGILRTYDAALREQGFQLGMVDTQSDEYFLMVFKMDSQIEVKAAVKKTGYRYYDLSR
jgi:hypothetical protein